jgi:hypothetical protein
VAAGTFLQRLSSMMLLDNFWEAVLGKKALVFQPGTSRSRLTYHIYGSTSAGLTFDGGHFSDSIMCARSTHRIADFTQYVEIAVYIVPRRGLHRTAGTLLRGATLVGAPMAAAMVYGTPSPS